MPQRVVLLGALPADELARSQGPLPTASIQHGASKVRLRICAARLVTTCAFYLQLLYIYIYICMYIYVYIVRRLANQEFKVW